MAISMIPLGFCIRFSLGLVFFFFFGVWIDFELGLGWVFDGFRLILSLIFQWVWIDFELSLILIFDLLG